MQAAATSHLEEHCAKGADSMPLSSVCVCVIPLYYDYTPIPTAKIQTTDSTKCWPGRGAIGTSFTAVRDGRLNTHHVIRQSCC